MSDLTAIKAKLPIHKLGDALGIKAEQETAKWVHALCPFHHDTKPSFLFDKINQTAQCKGACSTDLGRMDHIALIQAMENLPKEMAIDRLYQLAGEERPADTVQEILGRILSKLMANVEMEDPASFFKSRGINPETLREMMVGYSPSYAEFRKLTEEIPFEDAARLEFFRTEMFDRAIIYPTFDGLGRIAGFRARNLNAFSDFKYIANKKEFPFRSARVYGQHLIKGRQIILVEGPNDVLALRSAGVKNVGGLMGLDTKNELGRYLTECGYSDIVLVTDGDKAGMNAMMSAPAMFRVAQIPNGLDPDEFISSGPGALVELSKIINEAKYPFEIKLDNRLRHFKGDTLTAKVSLIKSIAQDVSDGLPSIIVLKLRTKIAEALGIPDTEIESIFELAEHDTTTLEEKIVWHLFEKGELYHDIVGKIPAKFFSNIRVRRQYQEILDGLSPSEEPYKREGLTKGDVEQFVDIANRRYVKGVLTKAVHASMNMSEPLEDVLGITLNRIASVITDDIRVSTSTQLMEVGIQNAIERAKHPGELLGVSFGDAFPRLNMITQGLVNNRIYILAANQGVGKSALALNWAVDMAFRQKVPTLWLSLEMSELDMSTRLLSQINGADATKILTGTLDEKETVALAQDFIKNSGSPFYTAHCGMVTISQIVALIRKYKQQYDIKVVIIDYIQLIQSGGSKESLFEKGVAISSMIKGAITQDNSIGLPVLAIAQLSKEGVKHNKVDGGMPTGEEVGESYRYAQDCDVLMTIRQRSEKELDKDRLDGNRNGGNFALCVAKNRSGIGQVVINMIFDKATLRIRETIGG